MAVRRWHAAINLHFRDGKPLVRQRDFLMMMMVMMLVADDDCLISCLALEGSKSPKAYSNLHGVQRSAPARQSAYAAARCCG